MSHVTDDLEPWALGALPPADAARVVAHLASCSACREAAADLARVVSALSETVPSREPPTALRARVLAGAGVDRRAMPGLARIARLGRAAVRPGWLAAAALAAAVAVLGALDLRQQRELATANDDVLRYEQMAERFSQGGRWWYMAGEGDAAGSGGTLVVPRRDGPAFVLFHDLRPLSAGSTYAIWLVSPEGQWVRGANFRPDGRPLQTVELAVRVASFERCAVSVERRPEGKRDGPIIMSSRIAPSASSAP